MADTTNPPTRGNLQVFFDPHQCQPSDGEYDKMLDGLDTLARQVEDFPQHDLRILIEWNNRSNDYSVKTTLLLPGRTLVCNEHDPVMHAAFERCVASLEASATEYKSSLNRVAERQKLEKGTQKEILPLTPVDSLALADAVRAGDYPAFRTAIAGFEDPLRLRAGRWVERYPDVQARMGHGLEINDVVDEVFLDAFEQYEHRPNDVPLGDWLENLLDPAVRALEAHPDEELENINMARAACAAGPAPNAVPPGRA
jgi:ribosome-associated translation inhibitor RaiA